MGYTKDTIKGISWVGALQLATRGIAIFRIIILARILVPTQFGIAGIATLILGLIETLTETGINIFLIQEEDAEKYFNTAWVVSIIRGFVIGCAIIISAPFIATFFNSQQALPLLYLISVVPIIRGFINPAEVLFQKRLAFNKEFRFRFVIFVVDALVAVTLALITHEAISLIWGFLAGAICEVILSFVFITPRPKMQFNFQNVKHVFHRGKWATAFSSFDYAFQNGDNIMVGRILGDASLGLYQVGYKIATLPSVMVDGISRVTFPVFAKIEGDKKRLARAYIRTISIIAFFTVPFGLLLFFFTEQAVELLLGRHWLEVVPVLKLLALFGIIRALANSASALFLSVKKQEYVTVVTFVGFIGLIISIIPLVIKFGIIGAAISAIFGTILTLPFIGYFIWRIFYD